MSAFFNMRSSLQPGSERNHAEDVQVPWSVWQLHHSDLLAAVAGVSRSGQLPKGEISQGREGGPAAWRGEQRSQPRSDRGDLQLHLA